MPARAGIVCLAESEGFEPPLGFPKPDFESGAFDHSANSPVSRPLYRIVPLLPTGPVRASRTQSSLALTTVVDSADSAAPFAISRDSRHAIQPSTSAPSTSAAHSSQRFTSGGFRRRSAPPSSIASHPRARRPRPTAMRAWLVVARDERLDRQRARSRRVLAVSEHERTGSARREDDLLRLPSGAQRRRLGPADARTWIDVAAASTGARTTVDGERRARHVAARLRAADRTPSTRRAATARRRSRARRARGNDGVRLGEVDVDAIDGKRTAEIVFVLALAIGDVRARARSRHCRGVSTDAIAEFAAHGAGSR